MKSHLTTIAFLSLAGAVTAGSFFLRTSPDVHAESDPVVIAEPVGENKIQVAILLDTSSSMNGLINQARTELWGLVNELATTERNGRPPQLSIALYEYGKPTLGADSGFVRQISPLTDDLDGVSEALFALTTNGGSEYAGHVIKDAVENLEWDADDASLKLVFIAGNEGFDQGPTDYRVAIKDAGAKGITVNTIFCGSERASAYNGWADGARLAMGKSMNIDHNAVVTHIATPHDAEIARLAQELNSTYLGFGRGGREKAARQVKQDQNAAADARMNIARAKSKASALYRNADWDLVDAVAGGAQMESMPAADMPEPMRSMSGEEKKAYVGKLASRRSEIQSKIKELSAKRDVEVAQKRAAAPAGAAPTLKEALIGTVSEQAKAKGYK